MIRKAKLLLAVFCAAALFILPAAAYEGENEKDGSAEEFYAEQYEKSGAGELSENLPDSVREYFEESGIDPSDYGWTDNLTAESVFSHIFGFIASGAKSPLRAGAAILAVILISAALASAEIKSGAVTAAVYASADFKIALLNRRVYAKHHTELRLKRALGRHGSACLVVAVIDAHIIRQIEFFPVLIR